MSNNNNKTGERKRRRLWWQFSPRATKYMEKHYAKVHWIHTKHPDLFMDLVYLPKGFTCFDYRKDLETEERHNWTMIEAMHRHVAFEYDMLEIDRLILHRVPNK